MGAVFRAHDTRLGRDVAIKLLPAPTFADDAARIRLIREARLAASLNHPNVCTIHDVGEIEGEVYIAMEYVRGRPLSEAIPAGGLPIATVLSHGVQIADALAHAHANGIVHRDLKASNVVVTPEGRIKLLDFGLARRVSGAVAVDSDLQTLTSTGTLVGTPQYFAPEALRGELTDTRSDLWALGVLLYEMASGRLPFEGRTGFELSAAILHRDAAPLPERAPAGLRAVVQRCLAKDPAARYQTAPEVRAALEALQSGSGAELGVPHAGASHRGRVAWIGALLLAAIVVAAWVAREQPWRTRELKQRQLTSSPVATNTSGTGVISPDGKTLAVVEGNALVLRDVESGESHPLVLPPGFTFDWPFAQLSWYPDGRRILASGHTSDGHSEAWVVPVLGGRAHRLLSDGGFASVSRDGSRIAFVRANGHDSEFWWCDSEGENPRRVTRDDSTGILPAWPVWSPTGDRLAYVRIVPESRGGGARLESCDLPGRSRVAFAPPPGQELHPLSVPAWLPDGRMVFGLSDPPPSQRDMNAWSVRVDPRSGAPSGQPHRITQWQRLAFVMPTGVGADGKRMSVAVLEYQSDCFVGRLAGGDSTLQDVRRLTLDDRMDLAPAWTPDGDAVLFCSDRGGTFDLYRQALDAPDAEPLVTGPGDQLTPRVSPDRAWILYQDERIPVAGGAELQARLMRVPIGGGPSQPLFDIPAAGNFRVPVTQGAPCVLEEPRSDGAAWIAFDPIHGRGRELARVKAEGMPMPIWDLAPDGSAIAWVHAIFDSTALMHVISLRGAPEREIRFDRRVRIANLSYGADGRSWIVVEAGQDWHLLHVGAEGHETVLTPPQMWMYSARSSPDGRHVAYTSNTGKGNIWMLEDF